MLEKIIKEVFNCEDYEVKDYDKGLSNHNYLLTINGEKYIVRIPMEASNHLFNRANEAEVGKKCQDLDLETIYFNTDTGIKITKFNEDVKDFEESDLNDEEKVIRVAKLLKKLHTKPKADIDFNPIDKLITYRNHIKNPIIDLSKYDLIISKVNKLEFETVLCHNDVVSGNVLFSDSKDYLIDYEYAANNDPLFDVMSFLSENNITDLYLRARFYDVYFDEFTKETYSQLTLWEAFHNILWCNWAMMMYENTNDDIYKKIANDKYEALKAMEIEL